MTLKKLLLSIIILATSSNSFAGDKRKFCVWDPVGASGPVITLMKEFRLTALKWGVDLDIQVYTDEKISSNDFKAGICDAVFLTSIQAREFVPFGGSLDAIGGIRTNDGLKAVLKTLSSPKAEKLLTYNNYEVAGIFPVGSMFAYVTDKNLSNIPAFSGKRFSVLNEDAMMAKFAEKVGGSPVPTTLATWSGQFNNGNIDVMFAPALAYNAFELYQGMGNKGGILDYRLYFGFLDIILQKDRFPADFGNKLRGYTFSRMGDMEKMVYDAEKEIPKKYWIKVDADTKKEFDRFNKDIRVTLKAEGKLNAKTLRLLWKIRCKLEPSRGECSKPE